MGFKSIAKRIREVDERLKSEISERIDSELVNKEQDKKPEKNNSITDSSLITNNFDNLLKKSDIKKNLLG